MSLAWEKEGLTGANLKSSFSQLAQPNQNRGRMKEPSVSTNSSGGNRLCLDFVNLPFSSGDPQAHATSWLEFIDFLAEKRIVSSARGEELRNLTEADPNAAGILLGQAERLGQGMRLAFLALAQGKPVEQEWVQPINRILRITEGHDELSWDGSQWNLEFVAVHEGLEWLLAAIARSGAELLAGRNKREVQRCGNPNCQLLFYDHSRTHRRRWCSMALCGNRSKVAAFARRHSLQRARAHHA